jgi:hypothetical protein
MNSEKPSLEDVKAYLRYAFGVYEIDIIKVEGNMIYLENNYSVEIENESLFKLLSEGLVIAPFDDVEELCLFIKNG